MKLAFVGLGAKGQAAHLRNYLITPRIEVFAAAEIRSEFGRKVAARYGIPPDKNLTTPAFLESAPPFMIIDIGFSE